MPIDETDWNTIIEGFKQENPRLQAVLKSVSIKEQSETSITLESPSPFHTLQLQQNISHIKQAVEHISGQTMHIMFAEQPKVFLRPSRKLEPLVLSDSELATISQEKITQLNQDIHKIYSYQDFEIIDTALSIHIDDINERYEYPYFKEKKRSSTIIIYTIDFLRFSGLYSAYILEGYIKMRKIGNKKTEIVIKNPFWLEENRKLFLKVYCDREINTNFELSQDLHLDEAINRTNSIIATSQELFQGILDCLDADELLSPTLTHKVPKQRNNVASVSPEISTIAESESPLARYQLHPRVVERATPFWRIGEYDTALYQVCIELDNAVQAHARLDGYGTALMRAAFSPKKPLITINPRFGNQQGFMDLFAGVMDAIRNPRAHHHHSTLSADEAIEWLAFLSALFRVLDAATVNQSNQP